jgi:hypothetical protein
MDLRDVMLEEEEGVRARNGSGSWMQANEGQHGLK